MTEQAKFRLDEISKIEDYFIEEISQRKSCSKKRSKYGAVFDCVDKILIVLSSTSCGVHIISSVSVVGAPVGIAGASLIFSLTTGIIKKLLSMTRNKKKKHDKILMLAKSKLNSIDTLISQALNDMEVSHKEFVTILKEKDKYEKIKENVRSENEKQEIIRLSSVKSKT